MSGGQIVERAEVTRGSHDAVSGGERRLGEGPAQAPRRAGDETYSGSCHAISSLM